MQHASSTHHPKRRHVSRHDRRWRVVATRVSDLRFMRIGRVGTSFVGSIAILTGVLSICMPALAGTPNHPTSPKAAANVHVASQPGHTPASRTQTLTARITAAQAAHIAQQKNGGRILGVALNTDAANPYYRVRLLARGQIHVIHIPAHNNPKN